MSTINYGAINANRERMLRNAKSQRMSETSRIANQLQREHGMSRTDALRAAERWHCAACGRLSSIGDKPVRNPCRCADFGD